MSTNASNAHHRRENGATAQPGCNEIVSRFASVRRPERVPRTVPRGVDASCTLASTCRSQAAATPHSGVLEETTTAESRRAARQGLDPGRSGRRGLPDETHTKVVGATGFEPATSSSRTKRATKLRHAPNPDFVRKREYAGSEGAPQLGSPKPPTRLRGARKTSSHDVPRMPNPARPAPTGWPSGSLPASRVAYWREAGISAISAMLAMYFPPAPKRSGVVELPDDLTAGRDLEGSAVVRLGDEGIALVKTSRRPAELREQRRRGVSSVAPQDAPVGGIDLDHLGAPPQAEIVEQEDVPAREQNRVVLSPERAFEHPDDTLRCADRRWRSRRGSAAR